MIILTNKQKKFLKSRAHHLKPVVIIGIKGMVDNVINEVHQALLSHELIKIRINAENKQQRQQMAQSLANATESILVQIIGHIALFYRRHPKKPTLELPGIK